MPSGITVGCGLGVVFQQPAKVCRPCLAGPGGQAARFRLFELVVFCLGRFQDWHIRVGILPKGKEILVSGSCLRSVTLNGIGATHSQPSQWIERAGWINAAMIKNFLILGSCLHAVSRFEKGLAANVDGPIKGETA